VEYLEDYVYEVIIKKILIEPNSDHL